MSEDNKAWLILMGMFFVCVLGVAALIPEQAPDTQVGTIHYRNGLPEVTFDRNALTRINAVYQVYNGHVLLDLAPRIEQ